ncbi:MAG: DUF1016 N-terminal domain-containing protein [Planctomycetota bacterium]|nr:DUF1016 N-terminal domain-containing protein [Planctomycetota bacterium]
MANQPSELSTDLDFRTLVELCRVTHAEIQERAAQSINRELVVRNWLFGWYLVEFEQNGSDYATYGARTLKLLSQELKGTLGRGFSVDNLEFMRRFYSAYGDAAGGRKSETLSAILAAQNSETLSRNSGASPNLRLPNELPLAAAIQQTLSGELLDRFTLSWSHYVTLLTIDDAEERSFYEIEANQTGWSVRELEKRKVTRRER